MAILCQRVTLAQLIKMLSCDSKVTSSNPGNSLMCKKQDSCVQYTRWWDPFTDPAYVRALVHRVALLWLFSANFVIHSSLIYILNILETKGYEQ